VFINYFSITIVEFNLQTGRPVCMSFTLEGRGENYVKLSMRWCRGWVRTGRVASLSSRYKNHKAQPFGIHFYFGYCRPIPRNVNLKKASLHFLHARRSKQKRKTCHVTGERLGEDDTCCFIIKQVQYPQGLRGGSG
jgi:hypothetical protein